MTDTSKSENLSYQKKYKEIFDKVEISLKKASIFSKLEFENQYDKFKKFGNKKRTDAELFEVLTMIVFYSGFRASTVENKEKIILKHFPDYKAVSHYTDKELKVILSDKEMIKNKRKIQGCILNAKTFKIIVDEYGSFQNYLDTFKVDESFENLILLKEELEISF